MQFEDFYIYLLKIRNMRKLIIVIFLFTIQSCKLGQKLLNEDRVGKTNVKYGLIFNNRNASHKPNFINAFAYNLESKLAEFNYNYYIETGLLKKFEYVNKKQRKIYLLCSDKKNDLSASYYSLTVLDSVVIGRIKYYLDSLNCSKNPIISNGILFKKEN